MAFVKDMTLDEASEDVSSTEGALSIICEREAPNRKGYRKGTCKYEATSETAYKKISQVKVYFISYEGNI